MSTLVLTLPPGPLLSEISFDYVLSSDTARATRQGSASAALLPDPGPGGEVVAVVPARLLSWAQPVLPPGALAAPARLRSLLEGLLEEQLLDETADLHFALQPGAGAGRPVWVAVCDRAWLRAALALLEAAGRAPDRIVPEFTPGPTASGQTECAAIGSPDDGALVLTGVGESQAVLALPLAAAGMLAQLTPAGAGAAPVRADPALIEQAEAWFAPRTVVLHSPQERLLEAARSPWDLTQFDLAQASRTRTLRRLAGGVRTLLRAPQWRAARWALVLAALAQVIGLNAWAWQEQRGLAAQEAQLRAVLTQTFPRVQVVIDAPAQMQRELDQLRQASGALAPSDLEPLLAAAADALAGVQAEGTSPQDIRYANAQLQLRGLALDTQALAKVQLRLGRQGILATQDGSVLQLRVQETPEGAR